MSTRHRLFRWTFTRFRHWSAGLSDARTLGRRYRELAHRVRRVRRTDLRAATVATAF